MQCPCLSGAKFESCCEPYLKGEKVAPSPEALMRSRYTAHVVGNIAYIRDTLAAKAKREFDEKAVREWASGSEWLGLEVLEAKGDTVEFIAKYKSEGKVLEHHETAEFKKDPKSGRWLFVDGDSHVHEEGHGHHHHEPQAPIVREGPKIGRNDPCHCGSGKKFKKCCGG